MPTTPGNALNISASGIVNFSGTSTFSSIGQSTLPCPLGSDATSNFYFDPSGVVYMYDDFTSANGTQILNWFSTIGGTASQINTGVNSTSGHPGIVTLRTGGAFASAGMSLQTSLLLGGGRIVLTFVGKIVTLSSAATRFIIQMGVLDSFSNAIANGVWFSYSDNLNGGAWQMQTSKASVVTTNNSATTADTNFHKYVIDINAAASSVSFFIDGVLVTNGTITTNIPTAIVAPCCVNVNAGASAGNSDFNFDLFVFYQKLTTPR